MLFDLALIGALLLLNAILMASLCFQFAKNKTERQASVVFQSLLLAIFLFPLSWVHCWYWSRRLPDKGFIKLG